MSNIQLFTQKIKNHTKGNSYKSLHIAFSQSLVAVLFIIIDFVFSKQLSVYEFGLWKEMFFYLNLGIPLLSFGIAEGFKYFIAKEESEGLKYLKGVYSLLFSLGALILISVTILNFFHFMHWINLGPYYLVSFLFPLPYIAFISNKVMRYSLINQDRATHMSKLSIIGFVVSLMVVGGVYLGINQGLMTVLFWCVLTYSVVFIIFTVSYLFAQKEKFSIFNPDLVTWRDITKYGFPLYLASFIGVITLQLDKLIVSIFETTEVFAVFAVGAFEIPLFAMLSGAFSQQIFPKMVGYINDGEESKAKDLWLNTTKKISFLTYPIILLAMIFAEEILFFVYNDSYSDSVFLFKTYLLVALFRNNSYGMLVTVKAQNRFVVKVSIIMLILNLFISIGLYYILGLKGIVFGTLISTFISWYIYMSREKLFMAYIKEIFLNPVIFILICSGVVSYLL